MDSPFQRRYASPRQLSLTSRTIGIRMAVPIAVAMTLAGQPFSFMTKEDEVCCFSPICQAEGNSPFRQLAPTTNAALLTERKTEHEFRSFDHISWGPGVRQKMGSQPS